MLYGLETVSLRKRQESELEVAELKMLRFSLGVTRLDRIRNEYIRGKAHVGRLGDKVREARLRWFGHVQRRESEYIGRRMLDMELPGRRRRGRPKRRYMESLSIEESDGLGEETGHEGPNASILFARWQQGEEFVQGMRGDIHNAGGFVDAACGVNVYGDGKSDPEDLLSCPHYPLQGLAIGAISKLGCDAATQDALDSPSVEYGEDGGGRWAFLRLRRK
ncbi:hypothetical protein PDJAM_G00145890 [Pangasius djambal]|uniref:Uncharacterized protein n=1 Tax=Pangasius djambal TaxID=1691987 RepID=A0ACC5ZGK3_9TELE|nr:hypothetical protein [Pangasius djambal]